MAAPTAWAKCRRCGKSRVSWTLAAEGTAPSGRPSVATTTWYLVPALPRSVGLGPVSSPPRLARTEQLSTTTSQGATSGPARTIRIRATWTRAQQGRGAPTVQTAAQGGARSAPGRGAQLPPLHALADEEMQRLDDLDGRQRRSAGPARPVLEPVDDPRHQRHRPRHHPRLPVPEARETSTTGLGCRVPDELCRSGNRPLVGTIVAAVAEVGPGVRGGDAIERRAEPPVQGVLVPRRDPAQLGASSSRAAT